jgi:uncharacterized membrane protein YfcA
MISGEYIYAALAIFGASVIRGYSGFGFAMICAILLSFIFPPSQITPIILCLDVVASSWLLYKVRQEVDWKGLKLIGLGALLTLPLGTLALVMVPVNAMRIFISLIILCLCLGLIQKKKQVRSTGPVATAGVGMVAGFLTGVAALGGPPVILFYFSSDRPVSVSRASMIAFFLMADTLAIVSSICYGLIDHQTLTLSLGLFIPLGLGIWIGNFLFEKFSNEAAFRKQVIFLLMAMALVSLIKFTIAP